MMHNHVNDIEVEVLLRDDNYNIATGEECQTNQNPPCNNCARGIDRVRNRAGPQRKPDDSYFHVINTAFRS